MNNYIKYLVPDTGRDPSDVVEQRYDKEVLKNSVIIHNMDNRSGFKVFSTPDECEQFINSLSAEQRTFEEVIHGDRPQKFKLDIDGKKENIAFLAEHFTGQKPNEFMPIVMKEIAEIFIEEFQKIYMHDHIANGVLNDDDFWIGLENILITNSSGIEIDNGVPYMKYSYHMILHPRKIAAPNYLDARTLTTQIGNSLPDYIRNSNIVDLGTNKANQNLRMANCHKVGSDRIKRIAGDWTWEESLICVYNTDITIMPAKGVSTKKVKKSRIDLDDDIYDQAIELASDILGNSHEPRECKDWSINYDRRAPTFCELCDKIHENDNTARVDIKPNGDVYLACWRPNSKKMLLGRIQVPREDNENNNNNNNNNNEEEPVLSIAARKSQALGRLIKKINTGGIVDTEKEWRQHTFANRYSQNSMAVFEKQKTLVVHANMKLGKTKAMIQFINTHFSFKGVRIVVLSFRQTFTSDLARSLEKLDFVSYDKVQGIIKNDKIIIQVESIHRLCLDLKFDLLIIDECESVFSQFSSGLNKNNFKDCYQKFNWLLKNTEHILAMDANVGDRTYNVLKTYRKPEEIFYHRNSYQNAINDRYRITRDRGTWIQEIDDALRNNEKIFIPTNSLSAAETIKNLIAEKHPDKIILIYSSDTDKIKKKREFNDVATYWTACHCLIITPTVTAGVSYEEQHFDKVFPYFNNMSCDVETCRQMVARVRNVVSGEHYVLFDCKRQFLPTSYKHIREWIQSTQHVLNNVLDTNTVELLLTFTYDDNGQRVIQDTNALTLFMENKRIENMSRNNFEERYLYQIRETGASIELLENTDEDVSGEHSERFKTLKKEYQHNELKKIVDAETVEGSVAKTLSDRERDAVEMGGDDLTIEEKSQLVKYRLMHAYKIPPDIIDIKFVKKYNDAEMKMKFYNIKNVDNFESCHSEVGFYEILENIRLREFSRSRETVLADEQLNPNVGTNYARHRLAIGFMLCAGFTTIDGLVSEPQMLENFKRYHWNIKKCENTMKLVFGHFNSIPITHDVEYFKLMLKIANFVLKEQYDVRIILVKSRQVAGFVPKYQIERSKSFNFKDCPVARLDKPPVILNLPPDKLMVEMIMR